MSRFLKLFSLVAVLGLIATGAMANQAASTETAVHEEYPASSSTDHMDTTEEPADEMPSEDGMED